LIKACPEAVDAKDNDGLRPIHHAARHGVSVQVFQEVYEACPSAIYKRSYDKKYALHWATSGNSASPELVRHIISLWPKALTLLDLNGCSPLHCAAICQSAAIRWDSICSVEIMELIIEANPSMRNSSGRQGTPLHLALAHWTAATTVDDPIAVKALSLILRGADPFLVEVK